MKTILILALVVVGVAFGAFFKNNDNISPLINVTNNQKVENQNTNLSSNTQTNNKLDLSGQNLTKSPDYIFNQTGLDELNLSNNKIDGSLQAEIRNLQNLKVLNLSNNNFTGVPAEIGQLKNLEILDLSNNFITGLPYELGNLSKLKSLNLSGNNYSEIDLAEIKQKLPASVVIKTKSI